ncbi:MAG TPA: hypothetical protein RMH99_26980 [Sandaracinaceae bacterium LLY-WYZ-13_1]|nr:hypothetical protein [Sandaracinaceae bacterium LLY-WYZ-13_1]
MSRSVLHSLPSILWVLAATGLAGCLVDRTGLADRDGSTQREDAGRMDASAQDAGRRDAGSVDAGRRDAGSLDAGSLDAGRRDAGATDAGRDAGTRDAGTDAGPPDAGPPDAGPPDAGPPDAGPIPCDDVYGSVTDYHACDSPPSECRFYARLDHSASCANVCAEHGGTCLGAQDEAGTMGASRCSSVGVESCTSTDYYDAICVCSRVY